MHRTRSTLRRATALAIAGALAVACASDDTNGGIDDDATPTTSDGTTTTEPTATTATTTTTEPTTTSTVPDAEPGSDGGDDEDDERDDSDGQDEQPTGPPELDWSTVEEIVGELVDAHELNGAGLAIVDRDHGIVHEAYWGVFDDERISLVASSSKMVTAGVLAHLHDGGLLDLDAPVAAALDGIADWGAARPDITPAQLLSNSSGLVGLGPDPAYLPYVCQFLPVGTLQDCAATIFTTEADADDVVPPDTEFRYGGAQWQVAGGLAEAVSGRSWAELIEEIYIAPCGLDSFGFNNHFTQFGASGLSYPAEFDGDLSRLAPTDNPNMEGGLYTTVPDYARVLTMHLADGWCGDDRVLSTEVLAMLHADRTGEVYGADEAYGMGWFVDRDTGRLTDPGAYGSVAWLDLDLGHGGFLVVESIGSIGNEIAAAIFEPVADTLAEAGSGS